MKIHLQQIKVDGNLQPRVGGLDPDHVRELEAVAEHWPPLLVVKQGEGYLLVDGFHRLAAAQNLGLEQVAVEVLEPPTDGDLYALAFALNAVHGRPLSLSDRRAFAGRLLRTHPEWADREVGRRSGLSQPTVARVREDLEREAQIPVVTGRVGRDGNTYPVRPATEDSGASDAPMDVSSASPSAQRALVGYFRELADRLEAQAELDGFETIADGVEACLAILGEDEALDLAERLEWSSRDVLRVARDLRRALRPDDGD